MTRVKKLIAAVMIVLAICSFGMVQAHADESDSTDAVKTYYCNSVQREHDKKLNNGLPILHMIPPYRDYGRYFCIQAGKGGTIRPGLIKYQAHFLYPKQEVLCTWQMIRT